MNSCEHKLYTIGFTGKSAEEFFALLKKAGNDILPEASLRGISKVNSPQAAGNYTLREIKLLSAKLADRRVYLRLGLARLFRDCCWLQVNGVHTFPDLYDGDYSEWIRLA